MSIPSFSKLANNDRFHREICIYQIFFVPLHKFFEILRIIMTYDEYIAQTQQAIEEEHNDESCFLIDTPECQFVRGH